MPIDESKPRTPLNRQRGEPLPSEECVDARVQKKLLQTWIQRSRSFRLSILFVLLGASVFFWGLGYKLSQYENHGYTMPAAKLLSSNEDSRAAGLVQLSAEDGHQTGSIPITFLALSTIFLVLNATPSSSVGKVFVGEAPRPLPARFILSGLFFRPPPIHSVL